MSGSVQHRTAWSCPPLGPRRAIGERGSALVEALVAVLLLGVVSTATTVVVRATSDSRSTSEARRVATAIAADELERLRALDAEDLVLLVEASPARTLVGLRDVERDGRAWQVEHRLVRTGSAASGPLCSGQPAADVQPLRGIVRVRPHPVGSAPSEVDVSLPVAIAPRWPVAVDGALVVRVGNGEVPSQGVVDVDVLVEGPLGGPVSVPRTARTDPDGCAWFGGLATGEHRVTLAALGRVDLRHRRAGTMPDGSGPLSSSEVQFVVGVSRGSRPALEVALPIASRLRVEVTAPDGAALPPERAGEATPTGHPLGLWWWLEEEAAAGSAVTVPLGTTRWLAPGSVRPVVGACPLGPEVASTPPATALSIDRGEDVVHLVPLVPVEVVVRGTEGDRDATGTDGLERGASGSVVARFGDSCAGGPLEWRWPIASTTDGLRIALPAATVTLVLEDELGRPWGDPRTVELFDAASADIRIELGP